MGRAGVRRHDGHRRADRAPRDRPLPHPDLALRPRPGRAPRRDRAAALRAHPAGRGRALDRERAATARRGGPGLRPGGAGRAARPDAVQPGGRRPLQDPLPRPPGVVYSAGVRHAHNVAEAFRDAGHQGEGGLGRDAQARADAHPRGLRARRDRRARERPAARRGLELTARDRLHAPRADGLQAHLPAARRPRHAAHAGQGGGHRRGLRPPRHAERRPGGDAALAARPRRLSRRRDRGRPRAARPRPAAARRAPRGAGHRRRGAARAGIRARALANGGRAPQLGRSSRRGRCSPARAWRRTTGGAPRRCCTSTPPASCAACSSSPACAATATRSCGCGRSARSATLRDPEAFDDAVEIVGGWARDERREGVKVLLQALTERQIGRRDQAARWLWHLAEYSREVHEEYAVQRWPETKRLLGLLVNSAGAAHARNARRLVQASRKQDRRLSAALLAAALAHTPEAQQVLDGARMRMARKPSALARELLQELPEGQAPPRRPQAQEEGRASEPDGAAQEREADGRRPEDPDRGRREAGRRRTTRHETRAPPERRRGATAPLAQQVHLAGVERHAALLRLHTGARRVVDAGGRALAAVPAHLLAAQGVALAQAASSSPRASRAALEREQQLGQQRLPLRSKPDQAQRRRDLASSSGKPPSSTFRPMPSTAQPSWSRPSTRMPASLRRSSQTSFGHLIERRRLGQRLAHRHGRGQRQQRVELAQHERHQQRAARRRRPRPSLPAAAGALLVGRDERAVRRAGERPAPWRARSSSRSSGGGRAGRPDHRGRSRTSVSGASPSVPAASPRLIATASVR